MTPTRGPNGAVERKLFRAGHNSIAGIDEVGRGAWAGPLAVGVAVVTRSAMKRLPKGVRDSKQLTALSRERLFEPLIAAVARYAIGFASSEECDALGMTEAQRVATSRALGDIGEAPDAVIMDGRYNFTERENTITLVKADQQSFAVAAASVLAKVVRDRLMVCQAEQYPTYGFERNKGYASHEHRRVVQSFGLTAIHRKSWSVTTGVFDEQDD